MPLYKEDNFLIIQPGSEYTLFTFGLKDSLSPPQFRIPTVVYKEQDTNQYLSTPSDNTTEINPIKLGKIVDLDAFNALIQIVLSSVIQQHPILTINQIPLLIIVPSLAWSRRQLEYVTKFVFETLEITAFNILDLSLGATFSFASTVNSIVVNIADDNVQIVPVIGYQSVKFAGEYIPGKGGITLDEELKIKFPNFTPQQIEDLKFSGIFEFLLEGEESIGDINPDADMDTEDPSEFDVAKVLTDDNGQQKEEVDETQVKSNKELEKNYFIDSSTQEKVWVGKERFTTDSKLIGIVASGIYKTLLRINDLDKRQDCYDNIILVGSSVQVPGLKQKIYAYLLHNYLVKEPVTTNGAANTQNNINSAIAKYQQTDDAQEGDSQSAMSQVPYRIRFTKIPDYFPEWKKPKEKGGSWHDCFFLGGEIYAKQIFSGGSHHHNKELFIGSEMYEERGPQSIWDVSI
ncbi:Arp9 protein [Candida orthopsilosis Co 90-125]|uniref:Arp9 protein n=1 Tax=Candida orthopsilosis (strain 90-125) TaxID=1136231 RepID=H8X128_CANO9|nr:Arp9 protein [Candida orthopsilosis Co 90-125]CCG22068.1 Arp9 protein [Candida orthopsilosis Co 90-125]